MRLGAKALHLASGTCLALAILAGFAARAADSVFIPNFWDPRARAEKPDLGSIRVIRFLTDDEYPPLHFAQADGNPTGFSVELARAACDKLGVACTIQVRRFETLLDALAEGRGDAVAAAIPTTAALRQRFAITSPYHRTPARFAVRKGANLPEPTADSVAGHTIGVVGNSAHEAYVTDFFPKAERKRYFDFPAARAALRRGEIDYLFADGMTMALWLSGTDATDCCTFVSGPYLSVRYFGEGVGFIVRREDEPLRRALDYALQKLWDDGVYTELYLRYFPVSFY